MVVVDLRGPECYECRLVRTGRLKPMTEPQTTPTGPASTGRVDKPPVEKEVHKDRFELLDLE